MIVAYIDAYERLLPILKEVHRDVNSVYAARKMWHALERLGEPIGRDQVARLMRSAALRGVSRRRRQRRVSSQGPVERAEDLVRRDWFRNAPDDV